MILIQSTPSILACLLLINLGIKVGNLMPVLGSHFYQFLFLGWSLVLIVMIDEPGWNILLGAGHCLISGMVFSWTEIIAESWEVGVIGVWVLLSFVIGQQLKIKSNRFFSRIMLADLLVYSCGWLLIDLGVLPESVRKPWMMLGWILFGVLLMIEFNRVGQIRNQGKVVYLSLRLYLISLTMYWTYKSGVL